MRDNAYNPWLLVPVRLAIAGAVLVVAYALFAQMRMFGGRIDAFSIFVLGSLVLVAASTGLIPWQFAYLSARLLVAGTVLAVAYVLYLQMEANKEPINAFGIIKFGFFVVLALSSAFVPHVARMVGVAILVLLAWALGVIAGNLAVPVPAALGWGAGALRSFRPWRVGRP